MNLATHRMMRYREPVWTFLTVTSPSDPLIIMRTLKGKFCKPATSLHIEVQLYGIPKSASETSPDYLRPLTEFVSNSVKGVVGIDTTTPHSHHIHRCLYSTPCNEHTAHVSRIHRTCHSVSLNSVWLPIPGRSIATHFRMHLSLLSCNIWVTAFVQSTCAESMLLKSTLRVQVSHCAMSSFSKVCHLYGWRILLDRALRLLLHWAVHIDYIGKTNADNATVGLK